MMGFSGSLSPLSPEDEARSPTGERVDIGPRQRWGELTIGVCRIVMFACLMVALVMVANGTPGSTVPAIIGVGAWLRGGLLDIERVLRYWRKSG